MKDKHICPHCESADTQYDNLIYQYWCNDCWMWDDEGDPDEESRHGIAKHENTIIDKQEKSE